MKSNQNTIQPSTDKTVDDKIIDESQLQNLKDAYRQHSMTFRTWMVAFGVGFPAFIATNKNILKNGFCKQHPQIIKCFLAGVAIQVVLSLIDKYCDIACLYAARGWKTKDSLYVKLGIFWQKHDTPSIIADFASVALLFGAALHTIQYFDI